eukprot:1276847-Rhodomonas_salina.1
MEADGLAYAATVLGAIQGEPRHAGIGAAEERWLVEWDDGNPDGPVVTTECILRLITAAELEHLAMEADRGHTDVCMEDC